MDYSKAFSSFSVDNLDRAEAFYRETLGVSVTRNQFGLDARLKGGQHVFVYPKSDHVPATFTVLNLMVDDIEAAVDVLSEAGISFEQYADGEMKPDERGIHRGGGMEMAWFRDPAGNYISLIEQK